LIKLDWQAIASSIFSRTGLIVIGLCILLIGSTLYLTQCGENLYFWHGVKGTQANINAAITEISNINGQIANLQVKKTELQVNINADTQALANQVYGREEIKTEVNKTLANYQKSVNANSNVNATTEDFQKALDKLNQE
jgi:biopolymer transport protein ExbB/TolQ